MSHETLVLLKTLLDQVQLSASHPEFEQAAVAIATAQRELDAAIAKVAASTTQRDTTSAT